MAGLTKKKITVKRKGKTFQRSVMVRAGDKVVRDNGHIPAKHNIDVQLKSATAEQAKQARQAVMAINKAHTHGNTPDKVSVRVGKSHWLTGAGHHHGHGVVTQYSYDVAVANSGTMKKFAAVLKATGNQKRLDAAVERAYKRNPRRGEEADNVAYRATTSFDGAPRFQHAYGQWVGQRAGVKISAHTMDTDLSAQSRRTGVPIDYNRREMTHISRFFDHEFGGRGRSR